MTTARPAEAPAILRRAATRVLPGIETPTEVNLAIRAPLAIETPTEDNLGIRARLAIEAPAVGNPVTPA